MARGSTFLMVATLLSAAVARAGDAPGGVTIRQQDHMGTYVSITVAAPESPEVLAAVQAGFAEVERLEQLLSEWRPDSQVSLVNRRAGEAAVAVDPELFEVARRAHRISRLSGGAFDVTFQALGGLWDFKAAQPHLPDPDEIARRVKLVDYRQVVLDPEARTIFLKKKGMAMGLGGIAKGYVVDRVSAVLAQRGFPDHLVIAGGDLYAAGTRGDRKWRIGVRHPKHRGIHATLELQDAGVATSGNYEKFFFLDGVRYHHLLDPKTGRPARGVSSVTVIAPSAAEADAWATALFVLGVEPGLAKAAEQGLEAYYFDEGYRTSGTPGALERLELVKK